MYGLITVKLIGELFYWLKENIKNILYYFTCTNDKCFQEEYEGNLINWEINCELQEK